MNDAYFLITTMMLIAFLVAIFYLMREKDKSKIELEVSELLDQNALSLQEDVEKGLLGYVALNCRKQEGGYMQGPTQCYLTLSVDPHGDGLACLPYLTTIGSKMQLATVAKSERAYALFIEGAEAKEPKVFEDWLLLNYRDLPGGHDLVFYIAAEKVKSFHGKPIKFYNEHNEVFLELEIEKEIVLAAKPLYPKSSMYTTFPLGVLGIQSKRRENDLS